MPDTPCETFAYDPTDDAPAIKAMVEEYMDIFAANAGDAGGGAAVAAAIEFGRLVEAEFTAKPH